jgi:hypothetical protein
MPAAQLTSIQNSHYTGRGLKSNYQQIVGVFSAITWNFMQEIYESVTTIQNSKLS